MRLVVSCFFHPQSINLPKYSCIQYRFTYSLSDAQLHANTVSTETRRCFVHGTEITMLRPATIRDVTRVDALNVAFAALGARY